MHLQTIYCKCGAPVDTRRSFCNKCNKRSACCSIEQLLCSFTYGHALDKVFDLRLEMFARYDPEPFRQMHAITERNPKPVPIWRVTSFDGFTSQAHADEKSLAMEMFSMRPVCHNAIFGGRAASHITTGLGMFAETHANLAPALAALYKSKSVFSAEPSVRSIKIVSKMEQVLVEEKVSCDFKALNESNGVTRAISYELLVDSSFSMVHGHKSSLAYLFQNQ